MTVFIDADGCPVVDITVKLSVKAKKKCVIICDTSHVFEKAGAETITVPKGSDSVDFTLVNLIKKGDIAVTQDYGLAAMCLARGAVPISQDGMLYDDGNIDGLLMQRHTAKKIRMAGGRIKGPAKRTPEQNLKFEASLRSLLAGTEFEAREVTEPGGKARICDEILRALPDWFGIEESIVDYVSQVKSLPFYAVFNGEKPIGFAAVKPHNAYTVEVCVMGVLSEEHGRGAGKMLVACCENYCKEHKMEFLTVKTVDESRADKFYEKTRRFYLAMGFRPLEVFPLLWDECNPCLFMAKSLNYAV